MDASTKKSIDKILSSSSLMHGKESFIYTFTNENIKQYLSYFDLSNKDILTVTGSGDHVLNMLLSVDKIDTFDINRFAYYFFLLKKYAIVSLELDEYLDFLSTSSDSFDMKTFHKIKQVWQEEKYALEFFEYLFSLDQARYLKKTSLFVNNKKEDEQKNIRRNNYLEEENYYSLKKIIMDKQVIFHHSNIKSLDINSEFDYIFMSNITDYLYNMFDGDILRNYKRFLYSKLALMLKEKGKIVSYLYNGKIQNFSKEEVSRVLDYGFIQKSVGNDKILIYEKNY